ncbi:TAXI family TRAP transporter solute-binding subunit [Shumkonia mesophila]|uniref:TAXI family TRAP transporter solute-binding subunit n=1 Tax=Shumkonia mesophila TaxID=2838854 RepID=UPI002934547E|nr:TAXI family TRAP transporter solute-binding subunit [Shumkonia mesophila]
MDMRRLPIAAAAVFMAAWSSAAALAADAPAPLAVGQLSYKPDAIPRSQYMEVLGGDALQPSTTGQARDYFVAIYSGSTIGVYYYVASAICRAMEKNFAKHRIHCVPLRSLGVASNVSLMEQGRAQFVIVQSDTNYYASKGQIALPGGHSVMSLHNELGAMAVGRESGILGPADLRDKRVNLGSEGTASRALWLEFLAAQGLAIGDLEQAFSVTQEYNVMGLCGDYIDAFGLWIGHPAAPFRDAAEICGARIVGMASPGTDKLLGERSFYFHGEIPANTYPDQQEPVRSYGFKASLIAYQPVDPYLVYWVTRSVVEEIQTFRSAHPSLSAVKTREMFEQGNFLPFHPGAARYWREIGWLREPPIN